MRHFNPGLAFHDGKLMIAIRSCNFSVKPKGEWYYRDNSAYSRTDVLYGEIDPDTLQVSNLHKLELSENSPMRIKVTGLEDVRLFSRPDGMHAIGFESDRLSRSLHNETATMAEFLIKDGTLQYIRTLRKPSNKIVEKNWAPTDIPSKLFDFTYSPSQVWKEGDVQGAPYGGIIHGGTKLLKQPDGTYLSIVHDKVPLHRTIKIYDRYVYRTYLARHDAHGFITHMTPHFRFDAPEYIQFASDMVEHEEKLIITMGIGDYTWAICRVPTEQLTALLQPYTPEPGVIMTDEQEAARERRRQRIFELRGHGRVR